MTVSDYDKILFYSQYPDNNVQGEAEIFAYRINNNILLTTNKFNSKIIIYIYEYSEASNKYSIYMIPFDSIKDFFNQLKNMDKSHILKKYLRSAGLTQRKNKLPKTKSTINYEKIANFNV